MYAYKGVGPGGKTINGVRDADSPKALRQLLRKDGVVVTDFSISKGGKKTAKGKGLNKEVNFGDLLARVSKAEVAAFTRQLATLIRAGIPLAESLGALFEQVENEKFKSIVGEVRAAVNEGTSLADALGKHPQVFDDLYVSMVRAGEVAGNLDDVLGRLADFMESSQALKSKVQGAMVYPIIMMVVGSGIMAVLMIAVVPEITKMFADRGEALPWNTQMLMWFSDLIGDYWLWLFLGGIASIVGFVKWSRSEAGKPIWHRFTLKAPLSGVVARQVAVSRFCRTLGTMLHAGVPMLKALETSRGVLRNVILMDAVEKSRQAVSEGESLALTLRKTGHFPPAVTHMVAVGERAGELEQMLMRIADAYDAEVNMKLNRLTTLLEPLMLVVMGGAVAFVVFSILMPIMDMGQFR